MINTFENIILSSAMGSRTGRGDAPVSTTTTTTTSTTTTTTSTTSTTTTCPPSTIVASGLVLYNRCCSLSGSIWYDVSGNGNHALVSGSTLVQSTGSMGILFNGTNNFITYPTTLAGGQPTTQWTMQWYGSYYSASASPNLDLFCKNTYIDGWDTIFNIATPQTLVFRDVSGQDYNKTVSYTPNTKILYTMTVDSTLNQINAYWNTTQVGTGSQASPVNDFDSSTKPLVFGWNSDTDASYFKGTMSDLILYNRILTSAEVTTNYNTLTAVNACF